MTWQNGLRATKHVPERRTIWPGLGFGAGAGREDAQKPAAESPRKLAVGSLPLRGSQTASAVSPARTRRWTSKHETEKRFGSVCTDWLGHPMNNSTAITS